MHDNLGASIPVVRPARQRFGGPRRQAFIVATATLYTAAVVDRLGDLSDMDKNLKMFCYKQMGAAARRGGQLRRIVRFDIVQLPNDRENYLSFS